MISFFGLPCQISDENILLYFQSFDMNKRTIIITAETQEFLLLHTLSAPGVFRQKSLQLFRRALCTGLIHQTEHFVCWPLGNVSSWAV